MARSRGHEESKAKFTWSIGVTSFNLGSSGSITISPSSPTIELSSFFLTCRPSGLQSVVKRGKAHVNAFLL